MRRIRYITPLLLLAVFWVAQIQGTLHGIGHLRDPVKVSHDGIGGHAALCIECVTLAQAGAAPLHAPACPTLPTATAPIAEAARTNFRAAATSLPYRSRAPPITLT